MLSAFTIKCSDPSRKSKQPDQLTLYKKISRSSRSRCIKYFLSVFLQASILLKVNRWVKAELDRRRPALSVCFSSMGSLSTLFTDWLSVLHPADRK